MKRSKNTIGRDMTPSATYQRGVQPHQRAYSPSLRDRKSHDRRIRVREGDLDPFASSGGEGVARQLDLRQVSEPAQKAITLAYGWSRG